KVVAATVVTVGGGLGGTIVYAKWDHKFRAAVEKNVPYSDWLFNLALGPKASVEATHIISAISEVPSVPAPCDTEATVKDECKDCHDQKKSPAIATVQPNTEAAVAEGKLKERPADEVAARIAQQNQEEQDVVAAVSVSLEESLANSAKATLQAIGAQEAAVQAITQHTYKLKAAMEAEDPESEKSAQWKDVEAAVADRASAVNAAEASLSRANEVLANLKAEINRSKEMKVAAVRPLILAAEENLHNMMVDLDKGVTKVQAAESEAKIVSQYSDLLREAKQQFQREVSSLTPEIQANWKGLSKTTHTGKLSEDDLNALIAHAHRRIDQLNRELAEQRVSEQIHIDAALEQQKLEHQKTLEKTVNTALQHVREEARLEQERKMSELREVMEAEMRTQLRRQAAAHTDHVRDVLKVQEQELTAEAEQAMWLRKEEARKAHHLWISVDALNYALKTADFESPTVPLEGAVQALKDSCSSDDFALALSSAFPEESLQRGVYSEASLRARFNAIRPLARRVALIDETHNSLYQYFLSYLQAALLFEKKEEAPPSQLRSEDLDPFKLMSYASYCLEHGNLELAAKLVNQLRGESRRVVEDWLTEVRLTLETRQVVRLLSAYANAVGVGTTQA
ncbi:unnamed protein product, partial [Tetraodon nigroviridis]